jgi:preprotein translocase subunit SecG
MLYQVLLVVYLIVAVALVFMVLIQQGKGADMGASFGAGGSNTIFGSSGSGNFMTRTTAILATLFFAVSLVIGGITSSENQQVDEFETIAPVVDPETPALGSISSDEFPVIVEEAAAEASENAPQGEPETDGNPQ